MMPYLEHSDMFRQRFFETALPYTLFVIVLFSAIVFIEYQLKKSAMKVELIKIIPNIDDKYEELFLDNHELEHSNKLVIKLLEEISSNLLVVKELVNDSRVKSLKKLARTDLISKVAKTLFTQKNYKGTQDLLSTLTLEQRLSQKVQFIYAFSLSKIKKIDSAIEEYIAFSLTKPNSSVVFLNLGLLFKKTQRYQESLEAFTQAINISSGKKKAKAFSGAASVEMIQSHFSEAVKYYQKSIEYRPDSGYTWFLLAKAQMAGDLDYELILKSFDRAISLNSKDFRFHFSKAKVQIQFCDFENAIQSLQIANKVSMNTEAVQHLIAWANLELGKRNNLKKQLTLIEQQQVKKTKKKTLIGMSLYADKNYRQLISEFKKTKDNEALYLKALAYRKAKHYKKAMPIFLSLSNEDEFALRTKIQVARIQRARKEYGAALNSYQEVIQKNSKAAFIWFEYALAYEGDKQNTEALKAIEKAIFITSKNKAYQLAKARYLTKLDRNSDATGVLEDILSDHPNYMLALLLAATIKEKMGLNSDAIKLYTRVLKINPVDKSALNQLASILINTKDYQHATALLKARLLEQYNNTDARYLLAFSYYELGDLESSLVEIFKILSLNKTHQKAISLKEKIVLTDHN